MECVHFDRMIVVVANEIYELPNTTCSTISAKLSGNLCACTYVLLIYDEFGWIGSSDGSYHERIISVSFAGRILWLNSLGWFDMICIQTEDKREQNSTYKN